MKSFKLNDKKVFIPVVLIAMICTANNYISSKSTPVLSNEITLSDVTSINHASAEWNYEWKRWTPDPNKSGWQNFWGSIGNFFNNVWHEIVEFFSGWEVQPIYDAYGNIEGGAIGKSW
jgi:hypothetical protein